MSNLKSIVDKLETFAPLQFAESWDNVGLLIEPTKTKNVSKILLTNDLTSSVMREALEQNVQMIVSYHPPLFQAFKKLNASNVKQRIAIECIENGIAVYSPHTAIDAKLGGVNDWLARAVGPSSTVRALAPSMQPPPSSQAVKIVTFAPRSCANAVREAMSQAGAGRIGNYEQCAFETSGQGTFQGNAESKPTIGQPGVLERVDEIKIEMVCSKSALTNVIAAMREAHTYEEVAFDIFEQSLRPSEIGVGGGRLVTLQAPRTLSSIVADVKKHIGVDRLRVGRSLKSLAADPIISSVGICAGSGASLLSNVRCDLWLTGEAGHHEVLSAIEGGASVILCEHSNSERGYIRSTMLPELQALLGSSVEIVVSRNDADPLMIE